VSIVFWNAPLHALTTLSIHFYEREAYRSVFSGTPTCSLFKDHHNRCLILRFNTDVFAILPLRQSDDEIDDTFDTQELTPYYPSFVVQASQLEESIAHILDQAFLYEYREPTLAILFSGTRTATGLLELKKDTVTLMAVTLDLQQRASTTIFSVQGMPYDCFRVLPLPQPVGGLLVLGVNQVIHVDQAGRCTAIGVNAYAPKSTALPMIHRPELKLKLEGAVPVLLGNDEGDVLLGLRDSTFIRLRFIKDGRNVTDIELEHVEVSGSPEVRTAGFSCAVTMESNRVFLGSATADSVLLGYTVSGKAVDRGGVSVGMNDVVDDLEDIYGEDEEEGTVAISGDQGKLRLRIHDSLFSTAPIRDAAFATPAFSDVLALKRQI
jgi:cleavage and polyadenylation specificity factor subunit 1